MSAHPSRPSDRRALLALFALALVVRLVALAVLPLNAPDPSHANAAWAWGGETPCLAESLYRGDGFGDPWARGTGPSAWLTPLYPGLLAFAMELFGGVTRATAIALFVAQALASALTCVAIAKLGEALGLARAGRIAAIVFALYPIAIWNAVHTVWDTTFVALGLTLLVWGLCALPREASAKWSVGLGAGYGALLMLNPAPLSIAPAIALVLWLQSGSAARFVRSAALFFVAALAVCLPWMLRNQEVIGTLALRPNFGVELMIGNHDAANGHPEPYKYHPSHVEAELARYRELGEVAYSHECGQRAWQWIAEHPGEFVMLSLRRVQLFWVGDFPLADPRQSAGRGAARDPMSWLKFVAFAAVGVLALIALIRIPLARHHRALLAGILALFGAPYFVTHVSERYRFPIDPLLVLLATALCVAWLDRRRKNAT